MRKAPVGEQRVRFVEDEEGAGVARLGERRGNPLLRPPDSHRHQVGRPLLHHLQAEVLGQMADEGALARAGRSLQAQRETTLAEARETLRESGRIGIGVDETGVEAGRRRSQAASMVLSARGVQREVIAPIRQIRSYSSCVDRRSALVR